MIKKNNFYYLIEPIDVDGDKNHDGFLISQYKITNKNHKIFTKNKYITFKNFNNYIKDFKHKSLLKFNGGIHNHQQQIVMMSPQEYNLYMNNKNQYAQQQNYNQQPHIIVQGTEKSSFGSTFMNGLAGGLGAGAGFSLMDNLFDGLF